MTAPVVTAAIITGALLLTLVAPRVLSRWELLRRDPAAGLLLWQSVSISGVVTALLAAPVAALTLDLERRPLLLAAAWTLSLLMLARVLWSGHRVGSDLRRRRARQRELVDLVGERLESLGSTERHDPVSVLASASPTAYCLPGRRDRIVLSRAAVDRLGEEELRAVLAHEQTHLDHRHDLLLELFTVLHEAVPVAARAPEAMREVHLLAELLADRGAVRRSSAPALGRALVAMATPAPQPGPGPTAGPDRSGLLEPALTGTGQLGQVRTRLGLLATDPAPSWVRAGLVGASGVVLALPPALVVTLGW